MSERVPMQNPNMVDPRAVPQLVLQMAVTLRTLLAAGQTDRKLPFTVYTQLMVDLDSAMRPFTVVAKDPKNG